MNDETVQYSVEGQRSYKPGKWDGLGLHPNLAKAVQDMAEYMEYRKSSPKCGWSGFRIVKITTKKEVMP
jgi:hypothetical protein